MLAYESTNTITSVLSTFILVVGSISLRFSPVFFIRWPICTAVLSSFPEDVAVPLLLCCFWVHQAMELEVLDILQNSKAISGLLESKSFSLCFCKVLDARLVLFALLWV